MAQKKAPAPLIPAVIYARYSSSGQREESIEGQLRECHDFARRNGLTVVGEYVDKALTGRSDKRPDFQRMLRDCERGVFQAVICWKMDRFARNRYDSAMYKYKLKRNGVRIFYAKESIPEGPEGIILESVMEGYAEYYSENLSQNVKRGYYDSALELKTLGQTVLGLRKGPDGRFEIDPATAPIVRRIFEEYAAGERAKDIYTRLNDEGYRTSRGGLFNKNSLRRILQNEKYVGVYEFRDIRVEDGIPAIVDRELFDRCQGMVEKHHRAPAADRATSFLLTAKLFCGHCGEPMTGDGGTGRSGRVYNYYTCNGRRVHKCQKERAPKEWIEQLVVDELVDLIHSDDFVNEVADRCMEFQQREKDQSALRALEARQKENEKAIQNMLAAIEAGIITPSTKSRLMELEAERGQIEKGIAQQLIAEPTLERDQVVYFLERFRDGDVSDEGYRAFLVDTFLNSVYLYDDDKLVLVLNYTGERCKVTLDLVESAVEGDGLGGSCFAPFCAECLAVGVLVCSCGIAYGNRVVRPFQSVAQLYHSASNPNSVAGINSHSGEGRGSRIVDRKKRRSFFFLACSSRLRITFASRISSAVCSWVAQDLGLAAISSNRSTCSARSPPIAVSAAVSSNHSSAVGCCVSVAGLCVFRRRSSSMDNCLSDSELKLHPLLQIFFIVEPIIPAPHATGGSVGDILSAVRPADIIAFAAHQRNELLPVAGVPHTLVDGVHQPELQALSSGGGVVLRPGHRLNLSSFLRLEHRQTELHTHLVITLAQLCQLLLADVQFLPVLKADTVDKEVGVDVVPIQVGTDQHLPSLKPLGQLQCGGVCSYRVHVLVRREGLHHVIEHRAALLVVQQLGA